VRTGRWELEVDGMDNANAAFKRTFNSHSTSNPKKKEKSGGGGGFRRRVAGRGTAGEGG